MEITFRGKRLDKDDWVYGDLIQNDNGYFIVYDSETDLSYNGNDTDLYATHFHEVREGSIGQYINLVDINSIDIFMGDIVKVRDNSNKIDFIGIVQYDNASFYINTGHISCYRWIDYEVEVIGNGIDSPELLKDIIY